MRVAYACLLLIACGSKDERKPEPAKVGACDEKLSAFAKQLGDEEPSIGRATAGDFVRAIEVPCLPDQDDESCRTGWEKAWAKNLKAGEKITSVELVERAGGGTVVNMEVVAPPRTGEVARIVAPMSAFDTANLERVKQAIEDSGFEVLSRDEHQDMNMIGLTVLCR